MRYFIAGFVSVFSNGNVCTQPGQVKYGSRQGLARADVEPIRQ